MSSSTIDKCAACGKEGDSLKACTACKLVKYCNRDCQISHRKQHKKECKKRAAELYDEKLFQEIEPEECPICMQPLPLGHHTTFESCCGKVLCDGCVYAMKMSEGKDLCAFCRTPPATSNKEVIKRIEKLIEVDNAEAFNHLASVYFDGEVGYPQDTTKANELYLKAGELGCSDGYYNLGNAYENGRGVERDTAKAKHYWELAANRHVIARHNLGCEEGATGNEHRAMKHFMIAARAGYDISLNEVKQGFLRGFVTKDEFTITLRAYQKARDEMKSIPRDEAAKRRAEER